MKSLVTGGAGFIGSAIARHLLEHGDEVIVVDDLSLGNSDAVPQGAEFIQASICDENRMESVLNGIDRVFHQAALPSVPRSLKDPVATMTVNVVGTTTLFAAAAKAGVSRVVYASSSSVYGDAEKLPKQETDPLKPISPYAVSKLATELIAQGFHRSHGMESVGLRYFNVFGPQQRADGSYAAVIPKFFQAALRGDDLTIYGDGEQRRDFTFIDDVVQANIQAAASDTCDGRAFNIGGGNMTSVNSLANLIVNACNSDSGVEHEPERPGDVRDSLADIDEAKDHLGFQPVVDLETGIERIYACIASDASE